MAEPIDPVNPSPVWTMPMNEMAFFMYVTADGKHAYVHPCQEGIPKHVIAGALRDLAEKIEMDAAMERVLAEYEEEQGEDQGS